MRMRISKAAWRSIFRATLGCELALLLSSGALQWLVYGLYSTKSCADRAFKAQWKTSYFCVTHTEFVVWKIISTSVPVLFLAFFATVVAVNVGSHFARRASP